MIKECDKGDGASDPSVPRSSPCGRLSDRRGLAQLFFVSVLIVVLAPGLAFAAGRLILSQPFTPYGYIALNYESTWGTDVETPSRLLQEYSIGAVGFVVDQQLLHYRTSIRVADDGLENGRQLGFDLQLNVLDLYSTSRRFQNIPHPIILNISHYTYGETTNTNYGISGTWYIPRWMRFFEGDRWMSTSETSGFVRPKDEEQAGAGGEIWDVSGFDIGGAAGTPGEGWDEGAGGEWQEEETLGPTGWGDSTSIWKDAEKAETPEQKRLDDEGRGPLFAVPYPSISMDYSRNEYSSGNVATGGDDQTTDYFNARFTFVGEDNELGGRWSLENRTGQTSDSSANNRFEAYHRYRSPSWRKGGSQSSWSLHNQLEYEGSTDTNGESGLRYELTHNWVRGARPDGMTLGIGTTLQHVSLAGLSSQSLFSNATYRGLAKPNVLSTTDFTLGYSAGETTTAMSGRVLETVEWGLSRTFTGTGRLGVTYSSLSTSSGGGIGIDVGAGFFTRTPFVWSDELRFVGSSGGGGSASTVSNLFRGRGPVFWGLTLDSALEYRNQNIGGGQEGASEQVLEYTLDVSRVVKRVITMSSGMRYLNSSGGGSGSWSAYATASLQASRNLNGNVRYTFIDLAGTSSSFTEGNLNYRYVFYRILFGVDYRFIMEQGGTGTNRSYHELRLSARRDFG